MPYPEEIDDLTPLPADHQIDTTGLTAAINALAERLNVRGEAIQSIEAKLGIDGSTDPDSHEYRLAKQEGLVEPFGAVFAANETAVIPIDRTGTIVAAEIYSWDAAGNATATISYVTAAHLAASGLGQATAVGAIALANARRNRDTTLAEWPKGVTKGDYLVVVVSGLSGIGKLTAFVEVQG